VTDSDVRIEPLDEPAWSVIGPAIHSHNVDAVGDPGTEMVCFVLRDDTDEVVGGAIGEVHWGWFCLHLLWVREDLRGRGHGHELLTAAEEQARRLGAVHVYLDTFSFQAPDFYLSHGYEVFGELPAFPPGHERFYMRKELADPRDTSRDSVRGADREADREAGA